ASAAVTHRKVMAKTWSIRSRPTMPLRHGAPEASTMEQKRYRAVTWSTVVNHWHVFSLRSWVGFGQFERPLTPSPLVPRGERGNVFGAALPRAALVPRLSWARIRSSLRDFDLARRSAWSGG